ncbi:hypothetical protein JT27_18395 [Alcaligenes faecalis]|uniref:hypothetical protein n=1 Tax=Alcaligenes faecalis TaxID=511 RepID=UPI00052B56CE|nr:hypothetical protein [Alcaligenes faecalis]KGP00300.1 hypothetical protein JT27_18395 [Alcaligenes faecalis]
MKDNRPRGIRNNNPGNLEWGDPWQGLVDPAQGKKQDVRFAVFREPVWGIRALARTLITYQDKRRAADGSKINSLHKIISRWAPAFENNVDAYVASVGRSLCSTGVCYGPHDEQVNVHDYYTLRPLVEAIIRHETNGKGPYKTISTWYDDATIDEGLRLAGVVKPAGGRKPVVTGETVAAGTAGGLGAAQIAEVLPEITKAMESSEAHLSSGSYIRMAFGLATIALAAYIAYSQFNRSRKDVPV